MADPQSWDEVMGSEETGPSWDDVMAQKPVEGGFLTSAKQMVGATVKGAGQVAADYIPGVTPQNPVSLYGQSVIDANPTAVHSLGDIADRPVTAVKEAAGNAAGSMAGMVGARAAGMAITAAAPLTGPAAPVVAGVGQLVAWLGPAAVAALPSYGSIRDKQLINNPEAQGEWQEKAKAALGAAAVGAIETKFGPQNWALATLTKEGRAQLAEKFASTTLTGAVAKGAVKGGLIEGAEELVQNPIEQVAAGDNPLTEESINETLFGGAMGALGGKVLGGAAGGFTHVMDSPKVTPAKPILEAGSVDEAIEAFRFQVSGERPERSAELTELRRTYKDHTPEETAASQSELVRALENDVEFALDAQGMPTFKGAPLRAIPPQELPTEGEGVTRDAYEAIAALNAASGKQTIVYADNAQLPDGLANQPDKVFISSKTSIDPVVVAAHEAQHLSEEGEPQSAYAKIVQEELTEKAIALAIERHGEQSDARLQSEIRADLTGDAWADPTFHGRVIDKMRVQLGEKEAETNAVSFLDSIKNLITRIKETLTGTTFTSPDGQRLATQYVKNLERVHDALAAAIADQFIQKGYRPPGAKTNTSQTILSRALELQSDRAAAQAIPAFQRTAEQRIMAEAPDITAPEGASPELVSALAAAQKAPFLRSAEERLNLEAIRIGVQLSEKSPEQLRVRELLEQAKPLAQKGDLTRVEADKFKALNREITSLRYGMEKPGDVAAVAPAAERKSTLSPEVNAAAHDAVIRDKAIYMAIREASHGVSFNADTPVDDIVNGKNPDVSAQKLYNTFAPVRDALRKEHGDTVKLFRATGAQKEKATTNWATTREFALQFGKNVISRDVPVEEIIAVHATRNGKYHEVIVGKPGLQLSPKSVVGFHGTHAQNVTEFNRLVGPARRQGMETINEIGTWFAASPEDARKFGPNVLQRRLQMENPLVVENVDELVRKWKFAQKDRVVGAQAPASAAQGKGSPEKFRTYLKDLGYDGLVVKGGEFGSDYYVVLEPSQIQASPKSERAKIAAGRARTVVNIGLDVGDKRGLSEKQALAALKLAGVKVLSSSTQQSDTEATLVAHLDRPLTPDEANKVAINLKQEAIAQHTGGKGELYGPKAAAWGPFNPEFFLTPEGKRLSETSSAKPARLPVRTVRALLKHLTEGEQKRLTDRAAALIVEKLKVLPKAEEFAAVAYAGRAKRGWYARSAQTISDIFGPDAPRFAALLAALSPQTGVESNLRNALNVWRAWVQAGRPLERDEIITIMQDNVEGAENPNDSVLPAWKNNSVRALTDEDPMGLDLSGPKVNSFFLNLIGYVNEVTNDTWMANYAGVEQKMFAGQQDKAGVGRKSLGYIAFNARVREAAAKLTELTGEAWTPAEVQETIWSWAKSVYEYANRAGEKRNARQVVKDRSVTHQMIASTPSFDTMFLVPEFRDILERAGYGEELQQLGSAQQDHAGQVERIAGAAREAGPFGREAQERHESRAAKRLDELADRERAGAGRGAAGDGRAGRGGAAQHSPKQGRLDLVGVHYSKEPRTSVSGAHYGTGLQGQEAQRIAAASDERLKTRVYAYVSTGQGVRPEKGVGAHAHTIPLSNIYDADADPLNLLGADNNAFESALLEAGFDGYLVRLPHQGVAVLIGPASTAVPAESRGTGYRGEELEAAPAPVFTPEAQLTLAIANSKLLPDGQLTGDEWRANQQLKKLLGDNSAVNKLVGDKLYYKGEVAKLVAALPTELAQTRRDFLKGAGALIAWAAVGKAFAANEHTNPAMQALLRQGDLPGALRWIATNSSSPRMRGLAAELLPLVPPTVSLHTVEFRNGGPYIPTNTRLSKESRESLDRFKELVSGAMSLRSAYGVAKINRGAGRLTIFLRDSATHTGLNEGTVLHETVHAVLMARYDMLNVYAANPGKFGKRAADDAIKQYAKVWREFREVAKKEAEKDSSPSWLSEPYENPDEFISYALTDEKFQAWLKSRSYQGKTLFARFRDWVDQLLFAIGLGKNVSWLDAALVASGDLLTAAKSDAPDFAVSKELKRRLGDRAEADTTLAQFSPKEYTDADGQSPRTAQPGVQPGEELQRTVGGGRPAQGWARATRIRGKNGEPLALHRGAAVALAAEHFELDALGRASGNASSGLGVWFTVSASEAATYGESESFFLDIRNPRVIRVEDLPGFESAADAHAWREEQRAAGFDGLLVSAKHLGGRVHVVAFDAAQVVRPGGAQFSPKIFYSELENAIARAKINTAPPSAWKDYIRGQQSKGVKQAEVDDSGVNAWLDAQTGKVTKDELVGYLQENGVKIGEKILGGASTFKATFGEWREEEPDGEFLDEQAKDFYLERAKQDVAENDGFELDDVTDDMAMPRARTMAERAYYDDPDRPQFREIEIEANGKDYRFIFRGDYNGFELYAPANQGNELDAAGGEAIPINTSRRRGVDDAQIEHAIRSWLGEKLGIDFDSEGAPFSDYTLPGGKNYQVLLLTLPDNRSAQERQDEIDTGGNESGPSFRSSHFDEPNIIAHIRTTERTDADGKRVLFLEEIQSDWAQEGKKSGFRKTVPLPPDVAAEIMAQATANYEASKGMNWVTPPRPPVSAEAVLRASGIGPLNEAAKKLGLTFEQKEKIWVGSMGNTSDVATAPFVQKTEAWVGLALKRAIAYAVENNFEKLAWTTGEQQADRYSLAKEVHSISWKWDADNEGKRVNVLLARQERSFTIFVNDKGVVGDAPAGDRLANQMVGKKLEDVLGKAAADKINATENGRLEGDGLKIGGEGMTTFYDRIVPNVANDILKKLGGGRVGTVNLNVGLPVKNAEMAKLRDQSKEMPGQPGFDITREMKDKLALTAQAQPMYSPKIVGDSKRPYTPEQRRFFERTGRTVEKPTLPQRLAALRKDLGKKMAQGLVDQFAPLKALSPMAYMLARLSKGSAGALEALLHHGKLRINAGAYDADRSGGFIQNVGIPLHGELEDFLWWVAANRAERLTAQDRERLFSRSDIAAGQSLATGTLKFDYTLSTGAKTRSRAAAYADSLKKFDSFNKNALDMAEQSGLIDPQSRKIWEHEFYVPFYRVSEEDGGFIGATISNSLVRQRAFKHLKGGDQKLNSDLLANTIANWAHLIDASAKNRAAKASLEAAANMGVAVEADAATIAAMGKSIQKSGVWFVDGGVKRHFLVDDPFVLTAITSLEYSGMKGPIMDAMSTMKHVLTVGVTASPFFKIKNLIRDSLQAVAVSPIGANPLANVAEGIRASEHSTQTYVSALASGGLIRFGTMLEGRMSDRVRQLVKSGVKDTTILNSDSKMRLMYDKFIEPAVVAYNELGNRSEEISRAALFTQLKRQGVDHATAALMARDLMDFSLQGAWTGVRFLTQVVPFMNARMQGLYKLGRGAKDDPRRFAAVLGATAMFSVALMAAYSDDDDWKKREDWDRDNFWWFKIGGTAFRIPKPFEIGAIATLAERGLELFTSPEMTGERFRKVTLALVANNLSMNPMPQLFKPLVDLYANVDSFSGRPIETMGMENLAPDYRFTSRTSMVARAIGTAGQSAAELVGGNFISPVKIDHALRGYFGWLGSFVVGTADAMVRPLTSEAERPVGDLWKLSTGGMIAELPTDQSRYVSQMYEQARGIEQAYGTYRHLLKQGNVAEAREFLEDNRDKLAKYRGVQQVKRAESQLNERIRIIERSKLDPEAKRVAIAAIAAQKDRIARLVN